MIQHRKIHGIVLTLLFCALILSGCAIKVGAPFDTDQVERIQGGSTTQEQVLEMLGPPTSEGLKDGRPLWTYLFARVPLLGGPTKGTVLSIEFNENGVVESYSYVPY